MQCLSLYEVIREEARPYNENTYPFLFTAGLKPTTSFCCQKERVISLC